ncbi:MAG TPA: Gfo/Idh/MocA family oxidoreductase [Acidobacteriaceae bacterium]|nr:Gfo/Idh/MocA family oxidoreductase [Acidobacteriaceae bacterium]
MLNWLVIGIGDITRKRVLPAIEAEPRSRLQAVLTRDPRKAEAYPGAAVYTDLSAALADPAMDAVYVASPVALHAEQAIAALRAGRHVLCEKPVAMHYAEAQTMAAAAHETGRLLGVAYYRRLYPKLMRAKELIDEGAIGQPTLVEAAYHGWLESEERGWLRDPAMAGGGPLYDVGSHRIDACNYLFGEPWRATGMVSNALHELKVEDSATVLVEYSGGVHAVVDVRWNSRIGRDEFRIVGVEGEIDLTPLNGPRLRVRSNDGALREEELPPHANVHYPAVENFAGAVLDGKPLMCPIDEAIRTDWVTEQVMQTR